MPDHNRDPKRDHNFDNHPYVKYSDYAYLARELQGKRTLKSSSAGGCSEYLCYLKDYDSKGFGTPVEIIISAKY